MALQSEFKNNAQLVACEVSDPDHVSETANRKGDHVKLIKKALNLWLSRTALPNKPTPLNENTDEFDKFTGDLVALFKTEKDIRNFRNEIDRIVGKKTVVALDKELPIQIAPVDILASALLDVVVLFRGTLGVPAPIEPEKVISMSVLASYQAKSLDTNRRKLLRIGHTTTKIGDEGKSVRDKMQVLIDAQLNDDVVLGKVFVFGSSSGGRNAIDFTNELVARKQEVAYTSMVDAAFFPQDTQTVPNDSDRPTNVPIFNVALPAKRTESYFQLAGNSGERRLRNFSLIFSSDMDNKEIHGQVAGSTPHDLSDLVRSAAGGKAGKERADNLHIALIGLGFAGTHRDIAGILNGL